jgi:hypothetical protein
MGAKQQRCGYRRGAGRVVGYRWGGAHVEGRRGERARELDHVLRAGGDPLGGGRAGKRHRGSGQNGEAGYTGGGFGRRKQYLPVGGVAGLRCRCVALFRRPVPCAIGRARRSSEGLSGDEAWRGGRRRRAGQ